MVRLIFSYLVGELERLTQANAALAQQSAAASRTLDVGSRDIGELVTELLEGVFGQEEGIDGTDEGDFVASHEVPVRPRVSHSQLSVH